MQERQKIGIPVGLWNRGERELFFKTKREIEALWPEISVGAFSIQLPFTLEEDKFALQIKFSQGVPVLQIQAPFEYENSIVNYGESLEKTLDLATHFQKEKGFCVNYHVGITLTNNKEVEEFVKSRKKIWSKCVENFRRLADQANKKGLKITIENEPTIFIKPVKPRNILRPVYFPFGTLAHLQKLLREINRENVFLTFDCAHWATSQLVPSFITQEELINRFFPNENLTKMLFESLGCSDWQEYNQLQGSLDEWLKIADTYHLSNTTGIGVHLSREEQTFWGADGTFKGYLSKPQLNRILQKARQNDKTVIIEVEMDLENKTFQEPFNFLKWLKSSS